MKSFLQVENLSKSFGDKALFSDVTFGIYEGDKIGLIAKNGAGKTTLLRIVAGAEAYDSGEVTYRNGLRVAYLAQLPCQWDAPDVELRLFPPRQFLFNGVGNADSVRADSTQGVRSVMPAVDEKSANHFHRVALFADKNAVAVKPVYIERVGAHGFHRHVTHAPA